MSSRIKVVGAGVIGLSSALRLQEAGYSVEIVTKDLPPETTSAVAAAYWYPYKVGESESLSVWAAETYAEYELQIAKRIPGVRMVRLREYYRATPPEPWWRGIVQEFSILDAGVLQSFDSAYEYNVPLAETPDYLPWLEAEVRSRGVLIRQAELGSLRSAGDNCDLIVNCTGAWAGNLTSDSDIRPIRGQLQIVSPIVSSQPEILIYCSRNDVTYVVRRRNDCVLGGTAEEGDWSLVADEKTAAGIRTRCEELEPVLKSATTEKNIAGLRPGRSAIRLEIEQTADVPPIIHNYGHGGAGYTLCWGTANSVVALARSVVG